MYQGKEINNGNHSFCITVWCPAHLDRPGHKITLQSIQNARYEPRL